MVAPSPTFTRAGINLARYRPWAGMQNHPYLPDPPCALERAAQAGRRRAVQRHLARVPPPDESSRFHALCAAVTANRLAVLDDLLPGLGPDFHQAAFLHAVAAGQRRTVERLLPLVQPRRLDSWALTIAAQKGYLAIVRRLLPLSDPTGDNCAAVRLAAENGFDDVVKVLWPFMAAQAPLALNAAVAARQWKALETLEPRLDDALLVAVAAVVPPSCAPKIHARALAQKLEATVAAGNSGRHGSRL